MHARSDVSLGDLVSRGLLSVGADLRFRRKAITARVVEGGRIEYAGIAHQSPSLAAMAATGKNANGWKVWGVEFEGEWLSLDALRQRYRATSTP